jgi:hypothetical protein
MSGQVTITDVSENADGSADATFEVVRDGQKTKKLTIAVPAGSTAAQIVDAISARLNVLLKGEPSPAVVALNGMLEAKQSWPIPDPTSPPQA